MTVFQKINERLAVALTKSFGTMWMFYILGAYGLLALVPALSEFQTTLLYWSNFIQLIALPLLLVGTNILGRDAEARAADDHQRLTDSYAEQQLIYDRVETLLKKQDAIIADLTIEDATISALVKRLVVIEQAIDQMPCKAAPVAASKPPRRK